MKTIKKQFAVSIDAVLEVADVICEKKLTHTIVGSDEDELTIEFLYLKGEEEAVSQIQDIIDKYKSEALDDLKEE